MSDLDTIHLLQDFVKVLDTLLIFDLDNDLDICNIGAKDLVDVLRMELVGRSTSVVGRLMPLQEESVPLCRTYTS